MDGKSSIKIQNTTLKLDENNCDVKVTLNQFIPETELKPSTTYLITFFVKTKDVNVIRKATQFGAFVYLALGDKNRMFFPPSIGFTGDMDWKKQGFKFTTPATIGFDKSRNLQPHLWLCLWNATGTVWFDDIRIRPMDSL